MKAFLNRQPLAAAGDPLSSHLAAVAITQSGSRNNQKAVLLAWLRGAREPMTSAEIAAAGGFDRDRTARGLPNLERDGLVERSARRMCRQTGAAECVTWLAGEKNLVGTRNPKNPTLLRAREEAPARDTALEHATCAHCKGAGEVLISTGPDVFLWCDEARGKTCIAAERRRGENTDPNLVGLEAARVGI